MKVKAIFLDVDGVLTDGKKNILDKAIMKSFCVKDGKGIQLAIQDGLKVAIITSDDWPPIHQRAGHLGIKDVYNNCKDKVKACVELCHKYNISIDEVCFVGDDVNDLEVLLEVGLPATPYDSVKEVKQVVISKGGYIASKPGGNAAVREIIDFIRTFYNKD